MKWNWRIRPSEIAFDIDGVVADPMAVFVELARERCGLRNLSREDLTCYDLSKCLPLDPRSIDELISITLDDEHTMKMPPVPGASEVLTELSRFGPLRFVTARIWPESIIRWLCTVLSGVPEEHIKVIATGDPALKLRVLQELNVRYFVEDCAETCELLARDGIRPLLFDQPWNRNTTRFPRVRSWYELRDWITLRNNQA